MNSDFRVRTGLSKNHKFRDLARMVGGQPQALWLLYRLWEWTALYRPDGDLSDLEPWELGITEDEWRALFSARGRKSESGFIVATEAGAVVVHDWKSVQPYAAQSQARIEQARRAGKASAELRKAAQLELEQRAERQLEGLILSRSDTRKNHLSQFGAPTEKERKWVSQEEDTGLENVVVQRLEAQGTVGARTKAISGFATPSSLRGDISDSGVTPSVGGDSATDRESESRDSDAPVLELQKLPSGVKPRVGKSPLINAQLEAWFEKSFEWFYGIYPRHEGKEDARRAWRRLHRDLLASGGQGITSEIRKAIHADIQDRIRTGQWEPEARDRRRFILLPATYLNQRRWTDER